MKLAVNYSLETERLVRDSVIELDMFKCPDFSKELIDKARLLKPCYVFFITRGIGTVKIPFRINCYPEIAVFHIR